LPERSNEESTTKREVSFPLIKKHLFKIIAFDWDGTAVKNRSVDASVVTETIEGLLKFDVLMVVVTGTNFQNIDRQFSRHIFGPHKQSLFVCANRGSEVFGFDERFRPVLLFRREATEDENRLLDKVAEATKEAIEHQSSATIEIVYDRLNRRKIDLIPEWQNPQKSEIGKLESAVQDRLRKAGFKKGLKGAFGLAVDDAKKLGLTDARITSDVKHIEVGLTDKSDSIRWITTNLTKKRNIPFTDILILGDEFGPMAGFEGSDYRMYTAEEPGISYISVGKEPNGVPPGVNHVGGGPDYFVRLMGEQLGVHRKFSLTEEPSFLLVEKGFNPLREREIESLFTVSNGYLGTRGSLEEERYQSDPATLIAGVYCKRNQDLGEEFAVAPEWLFTEVYVDDKPLSLTDGKILEHKITLDMRKGLVHRRWRHQDESGRVTLLTFLRFASLADPHAACLKINIVPENYTGRIYVRTGLRFTNKSRRSFESLRMDARDHPNLVWVAGKAAGTGVTVVEAQATTVPEGFVAPEHLAKNEKSAVFDEWTWRVDMGQRLEIHKFVALHTSRETARPEDKARRHARRLADKGFDVMLLEHAQEWDERWANAYLVIDSDTRTQRWLNFAIYHLISAGNPSDEKVSISARSLTGTVYEGHIFWDTEIYILPFFSLTFPDVARAALMYRYHTLPEARRKAQKMGFKGALYAWESASTGEEMTPEVIVTSNGKILPVGSGKLEHHISAAVARGVWLYWTASRDTRFMIEAGAEIIFETARFWASRVTKRNGRYHIEHVEGPDEYHEDVNDDFYTNVMAAWNLERASELDAHLLQTHPGKLVALRDKIGLDDSEPEQWRNISANIYADMTRQDGVVEQFEGYFKLEDIDVRDYEPRTAPLDVLLGHERAQTSQVVKQGDVVMALYLLEDRFREEIIRNSFEYYDRRTGHGSSLSPSIYGLVAARLGLENAAWKYFEKTAQIDLADNMGNAAGGVHIAALGGLWQQVVLGFGGVRVADKGVYIHPKLPHELKRLDFSLLWRGIRLHFKVIRGEKIDIIARGKGGLKVGIFGKSLQPIIPGKHYVALWEHNAWSKFK